MLTFDVALKLAQAALAKGQKLGCAPLAVGVVDLSGTALVLLRSDGAPPMWARITMAKARTALDFGCSTARVGELATEHLQLMQDIVGLSDKARVTVAGGVPLFAGSIMVGAVGVAGDSSLNDESCAIHAAVAMGFAAEGRAE
ncbi:MULTISPECIES: GlcG/HbpS family heme-binding protein [Sphingobium]|uniref:GlcG/HbpS family heme-binding protein n=1 Tax=Sphingobium TaxID=165695 RepID=UPI0002F2992C|nr:MULTISPECIES: heme-binding protein [Sphingobium]ART37462.1 E218 [uncultured bacterium]WDA35470.1 heme-binding protein [Sphingobium sp. YC-XJ3]